MTRHFATRICSVCGKEYQPTSPPQKYCAECGPVVRATKNRASAAKWNKENPERVREHSAKWAKENPDKRKASSKASSAKWYRGNPEYDAVRTSKHRAMKYANTPVDELLTSAEWLAILAEAGGHCAYCDKEAKLTLDHVIPLSKGGKHSKDNVVPACGHCNSSKGNRTLAEWQAKESQS